MTKTYWRRVAESVPGEGVAFMEFDGDIATRQVEIYGDRWFDSRKRYHDGIGPSLCDQPLFEMGSSTRRKSPRISSSRGGRRR